MIDVYTHGSQVGLSIHGMGGLIVLSWFVLEMVSLFITKSIIIHKLLIWLMVRRGVKKLLPNWWKIDSVNILTIEKMNIGYKVYVQIRSKVSNEWTNDHIIVNWLGKIKSQRLTEGVKYYDERKVDEIKRWKRDSILEKIGI